MSPRQMAARCPGAQAHGPAVLHDWRFMITTRGTAGIVPAPGAAVHGVLWRCGPHHLHRLDEYEGVWWRNYLRRTVLVSGAGGDRLHAIVYVSWRRYAGQGRPDYLLTAVLPGAEAFGLPDHYREEISGWLPQNAIGGARGRYRGRKRPPNATR